MMPEYSQTNIGVFPIEWKVSNFADLCVKIQDGTHFSPKIGGRDFLYLTSKNIRFGYLDISTAEWIDRAQHENIYKRCSVKQGDLLLTKDGANTGNVAINFLGEEFSLLSSVAFLRFDPKYHLANYFLQHCLSQKGQQRMKDAMSGNAITRLTLEKIRKLEFPVAPLAEQRAISIVLSDVDLLLDSLDGLIAKKRDLKQAAMQQLLTGQTRLPGFSGDWEVKDLRSIGSTYGGLTGKTKTDFGVGSSSYITFMNVMTNVIIDCKTFELVSVFQSESQNKVMKGDLFFNGSSETPEEIALCAVLLEDVENVYLNSFCFGFRLRNAAEVDGLFLAYYLRSNLGRELMKSLAQGSTRYNLSKAAFLQSSLNLPSFNEQKAIAELLTEMGDEIVALEERRYKTAALKQGMMQELLSGRTRLV